MAGLSSTGGRRRNQTRVTQGANTQQAAYSKCRHGLLQKASELCTLCVVETALVVLSHGGKAFSFGHPAVDSVMNRFANCRKLDFDAIRRAEAEQEAVLNQLMKKRFDTLRKLEAEIIRGEQLKQMTMESQSQSPSLIDRPVDELNFEELLTLKSKMEELSEKLRKHMQERSVELTASTSTSAGGIDASVSGSTEGGSSADPRDHDVGYDH